MRKLAMFTVAAALALAGAAFSFVPGGSATGAKAGQTTTTPTPSPTQVIGRVTIDGISGGDVPPSSSIEVFEFSWGVRNPTTAAGGGGGGAGRATFSDLSFVKAVDRASPNLALACAEGRHIAKVRLEIFLARTPTPKYEIQLTDVLVSSVQLSGSGDAVPTEEVKLNYGKIEWEYKPSTGAGVHTGWDLKKNRRT